MALTSPRYRVLARHNADITEYVRICTICTQHTASLPAQPMLPWDIPNDPWQEIAPDYFHHSGKYYLLIADLFSKYPFLFHISSMSAQFLVQRLDDIIAQYSPSASYTPTMDPLHSARIQKIPAQGVHQSHHLVPPLPLCKWFHRATGEDDEDCTQHCPGCQNIPHDPPTGTAVTSIASNMLLPREILHNNTIQQPGKPLCQWIWKWSRTT